MRSSGSGSSTSTTAAEPRALETTSPSRAASSIAAKAAPATSNSGGASGGAFDGTSSRSGPESRLIASSTVVRAVLYPDRLFRRAGSRPPSRRGPGRVRSSSHQSRASQSGIEWAIAQLPGLNHQPVSPSGGVAFAQGATQQGVSEPAAWESAPAARTEADRLIDGGVIGGPVGEKSNSKIPSRARQQRLVGSPGLLLHEARYDPVECRDAEPRRGEPLCSGRGFPVSSGPRLPPGRRLRCVLPLESPEDEGDPPLGGTRLTFSRGCPARPGPLPRSRAIAVHFAGCPAAGPFPGDRTFGAIQHRPAPAATSSPAAGPSSGPQCGGYQSSPSSANQATDVRVRPRT